MKTRHEKRERINCYSSLSLSLISLAWGVSIPHIPGLNFTSIAKVSAYLACTAYAVKANSSAFELGKLWQYRQIKARAEADLFGRQMEVLVNSKVLQLSHLEASKLPQPEQVGQEVFQSEYSVEPQPESPSIAQEFNAERVIEESTGIGLLGNSGSGKSCIAKLLAGTMGGQILVLDPHDDPEKSNWEGLRVIRNYDQILEQLEYLLILLDDRDKTQLTIIADEWPAVRVYAKKKKSSIADDFLLRYGSEARKFNKLPIFCSQSGNTKALGLEGMGDFLENFSLIRLHRVARKYTRNLSDREVHAWCQQTAFPCLIGDEPYIHPTHGHHERFYKGAPPRGLKPLRSEPLTIPLAG